MYSVSFSKVLIILLLLSSCTADQTKTEDLKDTYTTEVVWEAPEINLEEVDFSTFPLPKLSDYGFFLGQLKQLQPSARVTPYQPASSLFTDYAKKARFVWMPLGSQAQINPDKEGTINFPDRTILIKNFYYPADFRKPDQNIRIIETRLMVKTGEHWKAFPYIWNADQTDASYKMIGGETEVKWVDQSGESQLINYIIPNQNQCKSCHNENEELVPIGVKAKHLNNPLDYDGKTQNQLTYWLEQGYFEALPKKLPNMIAYENTSEELNLRAMAYLDINCAHCHRSEGPASTSGLFLTYEEKDISKLGVFKTPVAAGFGAGPHKFDIVPGKADESILTYRMATNQVGAAMPEIGRVTIHHEGVELIKAWINAMDPNEK